VLFNALFGYCCSGVRCPRPEVRATCIALFLFCMNQVGGNLPVLVTALEPLLGGYRAALLALWPGCLAVSAVLFLLSSLPLWWSHAPSPPPAQQEDGRQESPGTDPARPLLHNGD